MSEKKERNVEIYRLRKAGKTYVSLALEYGLTAERVRQLCERQERVERVLNKYDYLQSLPPLPTKVQCALIRANVNSIEDLMELLNNDTICDIRGIGEKGKREIKRALGI